MDTELTAWFAAWTDRVLARRITMTDEMKALLASARIKKAYLGG